MDSLTKDKTLTPAQDASVLEARAQALLDAAKRAGAGAADVLFVKSQSLGASQRLGKLEDVDRAESCDLGLRVFIGQRQSFVSSTDLAPSGFDGLAERAVAMAKRAPADPYCGLAEASELARDWPDLDLVDPIELGAEALIARAAEAEEAALSVPGITNSDGASAGWSRSTIVLATSAGFSGAYAASSFSVSCSAVAGEGTRMERDYDFSSARHEADLDSPALIGKNAADRVLLRLNPRKAKSAAIPIVFDPRVAGSLIGHFASAINGAAVARGVSFLKDKFGLPVFASGQRIIDDPRRPRGLRSKPFDGEGIATATRSLVEDGVLLGWLLDCAAARKLALKTTGSAARGPGGPPMPAPTNLYLAPGRETPDALIAPISQGLYVTELIGMGVNGVTGDYSRGAAGFWIENGALSYPVSEVTVAGNLKDMFLRMTPACDLVFKYAINAPTLRIEGMTVAGT